MIQMGKHIVLADIKHGLQLYVWISELDLIKASDSTQPWSLEEVHMQRVNQSDQADLRVKRSHGCVRDSELRPLRISGSSFTAQLSQGRRTGTLGDNTRRVTASSTTVVSNCVK